MPEDLKARLYAAFGVQVHLDALAVAVFDHGAAPPGVSDRVFRFEYLRARLASGRGLARDEAASGLLLGGVATPRP